MKLYAKELRLGNYVNLEDKGLYQIDRGYDLEKIEDFEGTNYCTGILIDEHWITNFGYEFWNERKVNEYETYKRYVLHNFLGTSNHEIHLIHSTYGNTNHYEYVTSIDEDDRQYNGRMEFVHDLQNAVYKETNKELELTLNK